MKILKEVKTIKPDILYIELTGDIDYVSYSELKKLFAKIISKGTRKLIIDLTHASHIDSSGLGAITSAHIKISSLKGQIFLVSANKEINKIFDIAGLSKVIRIYPDTESSLRDAEL